MKCVESSDKSLWFFHGVSLAGPWTECAVCIQAGSRLGGRDIDFINYVRVAVARAPSEQRACTIRCVEYMGVLAGFAVAYQTTKCARLIYGQTNGIVPVTVIKCLRLCPFGGFLPLSIGTQPFLCIFNPGRLSSRARYRHYDACFIFNPAPTPTFNGGFTLY